MNWATPAILLLLGLVVIFLQVTVDWFRNLLGTQFDFLPSLMIYAGLNTSIWLVAGAAILWGMLLDSFSGNPLGVSVLPLFLIGLVLFQNRHLLLRASPFAQFVLGLCAGAAVPVMALLLILAVGDSPLINFGFLWQACVVSATCGLATPIFFAVLQRLERSFSYPTESLSSFRPDREIKRGRL